MADPILGYKFCDVQSVKDIATINPAYSGRDDSIESFIRTATSQIISHLNRDIIAQTSVVEYFGTPERQFYDLMDPVNSRDPYVVYLREPNISNLKVWLSYRYQWGNDELLTLGQFDGNGELLSTSDQQYFLEPSPQNSALTRLNIVTCLRHHPKAVKVQYDSGYPVDTTGDPNAGPPEPTDPLLYRVPQEIVQATAMQTGFLMSRSAIEDIGTGDVRRQTNRRDPRTTPEGVASDVAYLLRKWKRSLTGSM